MARELHLIVFDGDCGFCQWSVDKLTRRDRSRRFEAAPRQKLPESDRSDKLMTMAGGEVVVLARDGRMLGGATAVFFILSETGWGLLGRALMLPPWIWVANLAYRWVARNRMRVSRWLRLDTSCKIEPSR